MSTNNATGKKDNYYETKVKQAPKEYKKKECSKWPPKILCTMRVCHRGSTSLRIVPETVKVNNEVFLKEVLIPIWKEDIPRLYPGEERKVNLHMDGARAHFHPNVVQWLETNKIKYIPAGHWPANSPDLFLVDYEINGIFKDLCNRRSATTKSELMKVAKEVWSEIEIRKNHRIIKAWSFRVDLMVKKLCFQIEHFSQ